MRFLEFTNIRNLSENISSEVYGDSKKWSYPRIYVYVVWLLPSVFNVVWCSVWVPYDEGVVLEQQLKALDPYYQILSNSVEQFRKWPMWWDTWHLHYELIVLSLYEECTTIQNTAVFFLRRWLSSLPLLCAFNRNLCVEHWSSRNTEAPRPSVWPPCGGS
jgi:hypothetical protein